MFMLYKYLIDHQGNANQIQNEVSLHTQQDDYNHKDKIMTARDDAEESEPSYSAGGKWYSHSGKQTCNVSKS